MSWLIDLLIVYMVELNLWVNWYHKIQSLTLNHIITLSGGAIPCYKQTLLSDMTDFLTEDKIKGEAFL